MRKIHNFSKKNYTNFYPYYQLYITKFLNNLMYDGNKRIAEKILLQVFYNLKTYTNLDSLLVFKTAIENSKPLIELKSIRIGGTVYKVPHEILPEKQITKAIKSIILNARKRKEYKMEDKLTNEILDCYYQVGSTIKQKEMNHKIAESNRAYSHFRW